MKYSPSNPRMIIATVRLEDEFEENYKHWNKDTSVGIWWGFIESSSCSLNIKRIISCSLILPPEHDHPSACMLSLSLLRSFVTVVTTSDFHCILNSKLDPIRQVKYPKKLTKGCVKLFSPNSCSHEPSSRNKRYGILNFCLNFKMAVINQNGGQNDTMVIISAVILPILMIFWALLIFSRSRCSNLIFCLNLEFNMAAKNQNGCQKVIKFYKLVIQLSVYEFLD